MKAPLKGMLKATAIGLGIFAAYPALPALAIVPPPNATREINIVDRGVQEEATKDLSARRRQTVIEREDQEKREGLEAGELSFFVKKIRLEGNTLISSEEFADLVARYENKEQNMKGLNELADNIEQAYTGRGFITTVAYIPPQKIIDGSMTLRIVEGKVGNIIVEGNRYYRTKQILSYIDIPKGKILRYADIQKAVGKLNMNPDRDVQAILKKGAEPETTDLVFKVKDRFPVHASFLNDNQGNDASGKQRIGFFLRDTNLTTFDDTLFGGTIFGQHFGAAFMQYVFPIAKTNTQLIGGFSHSQVDPKKNLKAYGVNGTSQNYYVSINQRLLTGERLTVNSFLKWEFKEQRTKILSGTNYRERLRLLRAGPSVHLEDAGGSTDLDFEFSAAIRWMGAAIHADPSNGRQGVDPDFFIFRPTISRMQRLPLGARLTARAQIQFPTEKLPSSEAIYLGGANSIRGYPEGDYLADTGYCANFELITPSYFFPEDWHLPYLNEPLRRQIELVAFLDEGYGMLRGPSATESPHRHLMGTGAGLRMHVWQNIYARTEWAAALGAHPLTDSDRYQFYFKLQMEK